MNNVRQREIKFYFPFQGFELESRAWSDDRSTITLSLFLQPLILSSRLICYRESKSIRKREWKSAKNLDCFGVSRGNYLRYTLRDVSRNWILGFSPGAGPGLRTSCEGFRGPRTNPREIPPPGSLDHSDHPFNDCEAWKMETIINILCKFIRFPESGPYWDLLSIFSKKRIARHFPQDRPLSEYIPRILIT